MKCLAHIKQAKEPQLLGNFLPETPYRGALLRDPTGERSPQTHGFGTLLATLCNF